MNRLFLPVIVSIFLLLITILPVAATARASTSEPGVGEVFATPGVGWNFDATGQWAYGPATAIHSLGDTVLAGAGTTLLALDMRTSVIPYEVARLLLPSVPRGIDVAGDYAYVACDKAGLQIVDISDITNPFVAAEYAVDVATGVDVVGDHAFLANASYGLVVVDISDPEHPALAGQIGSPVSAWGGVDVEGGVACTAGSSVGLCVINVSDPSSPVLFDIYDTPGNANDVDIVGTYAYVADHQQGLRVIDISTPATPSEVGFLDFYTEARRVAVVGQYAYVGTSALNIVDISQPATPSLVGTGSTGAFTHGLWADGSTAFVASDWAGFKNFDVSTPASPVLINGWDLVTGAVKAVGAHGNYAYIGCDREGMNVLDISDPSAPYIAGSYEPGYEMTSITFVADTAYTTWSDGFRVLDMSVPDSPVEIGHYDSGYFAGVCIEGDYAYIAYKASGFRILDISDPASPSEVGLYQSPGYVFGVDYQDGYAYLAAAPAGFRVVDVSTPSAPVEVGYYDPSGWAAAVVVDSIYAYLGDTSRGLIIIDVSVPTAPVEVGRIQPQNKISDVFKSGDYVFVGHSEFGLSAVYVDDRTNPVLVGSFETGNRAEQLFAVGNTVYVADQEAGMYILEFDPPPTPTFISAFLATGSDRAVELSWSVHTDDDIRGFRVYRTADGTGRRELANTGGLIGPGERRFTDATGRRGISYEYVLAVVLADGSEIVSIPSIACACGLDIVLRPNYPNPFNPATTISFELPERTRVELSIFDARGTHVRTLIDGPRDGGRQSVEWDGRDGRGTAVGSGIYFCRLTAGKKTLTRKLTLVK